MTDAFEVRVGRRAGATLAASPAPGRRRAAGLAHLGLVALAGACSPAAAAAPTATSEPTMVRASEPAMERSASPAEPPGAAPASASAFRVSESGLGIEDLVVGQGEEATVGRTLVVHYVGTLPNGARFDSSRERGQPFELELGAGRLIQGWEEGLVGVRKGGLRRLVVPPHLGYGARGQPPTIPPDTLLEFEIELLEVR